MNFRVGRLLLQSKYDGYCTGLRQQQLTNHFSCRVPASELAKLIKRMSDEFSPNIFYFIRNLIDEMKNFISL